MPDPTTRLVQPQRLQTIVQAIFVALGLPEEDAGTVAATLVEADLRGVRSHGVMRVPVYTRAIQTAQANPRPALRLAVDSGPTAVVDGDGALGQVSADYAMRLAIARAAEHGVGAIGLRNGRHCGAMAYWAMQALPNGCVGFATTNAGMNMAPFGGIDRLVGNNPFAMAVPTRRPWPFVLDMATSVAAGGKLDMAAIRGEAIPAGWAIDAEGRPTTDPLAARQGTLLPVGGPKGYGMALLLDVLAGVLTGARFAANLGGTGSGQFYLALRVEAFMPLADFHDRMDALIDQIHASRLAPGSKRIYLPGEIEHELQARRLVDGMPLEEEIIARLQRIATEVGASVSDL